MLDKTLHNWVMSNKPHTFDVLWQQSCVEYGSKVVWNRQLVYSMQQGTHLTFYATLWSLKLSRIKLNVQAWVTTCIKGQVCVTHLLYWVMCCCCILHLSGQQTASLEAEHVCWSKGSWEIGILWTAKKDELPANTALLISYPRSHG